MTDEPAHKDSATPGSDPVPVPNRARIEPLDPAQRRDLLPILYLLGFLVLAGTLFYLWQNPPASRLSVEQAGQVDTLQTQIAGLREQVTQLAQQKPTGPSAADFDKLQQQVTALGNRPSVAPGAVQQLSDKVGALETRPEVAPAAVQSLADKLAAVDARKVATPEQLALLSDQLQSLGRQIPDLQPLTQRLTALEARPQVDPAAIDGKLNDLGSKLQALSSQVQDGNGKLGGQVNQLATRTDDLDKQEKQQADQLRALTQKAQITARLQGMAAALAAGQKLGDIPGAPPALARFASEAPPTEASLRETFDQYATAAQQASQPVPSESQDFGSRLWSRAQQAVTVRQGDRVLVGDPIAGVLAHAREKLDNGDLAGAVSALKGLGGQPAQAMQPWVDKAQALVAARAAIASLAAG